MLSGVPSWLTVRASESGLPVVIYELGNCWSAASWSEYNNKPKTRLFGIAWKVVQK